MLNANGMKIRRVIPLAIFSLLICLALAQASQSKVSFPGPAAAPDPMGQYSITCNQSNPHEVWFKDIRTGRSSLLLTFNRGIDVLWSPDGSSFAITDWGGSDYSEVFVYSPRSLTRRVDLQEAVKRALGPIPEVTKNHHVYFEALGWADPTTLRFSIHGYGDFSPEGFEKVFEYNVKNGTIVPKRV